MADIAGRPFLERLLDRLDAQGIARVVLAVGHRREQIRAHFGERYRGLALEYSEESEPLGTGGAIRRAFEQQSLQRAFVLNGDTWCPVDLVELAQAHARAGALATLTLAQVEDAGRYGAVDLLPGGRIAAFREKQPGAPRAGLINAGVYLIERPLVVQPALPSAFSLERDCLPPAARRGELAGLPAQGARFIDIGVPDDYRRAQRLLAGA